MLAGGHSAYGKRMAGRISTMLFATIFVTIATVAGALYWFAVEHDHKSTRDSELMVSSGLEALGSSLRTITQDYSWWADAYDQITAEDMPWMVENIGIGTLNNGTVDVIDITSSQGKSLYAVALVGGEPKETRLFDNSIVNELRALINSQPGDRMTTQSRFVRIGDQIVLVAIARVWKEGVTPERLEDLPLILMGYIMDEKRLGDLGSTYLINDLHIDGSESHGVEVGLPLYSASNVRIGTVSWTPPRPGMSLLTKTILPVSAALTLFAIIGFLISTHARRVATDLAMSEENAHHSARTDLLTGLPNRLAFSEYLQTDPVKEALRSGRLALLYLDIDGFKNVNDTKGHDLGDQLIRQVSLRLLDCVGLDGFIARVGGDEFNIVQIANKPDKTAEEIGRNISRIMKGEFEVGGSAFTIGASIGYACTDDKPVAVEELVRRADVAMYVAKNLKSGEPVKYSPDLEANRFRNKTIEDALRESLRRGELDVLYQPIVDSSGTKLEIAEALVRWSPKDIGPVSPATFIPIAEEAGLIGDLGNLVARKVCADMRRWPDLRVSLNLSPLQLRDPMFVENLMTIVNQAGIDPQRLELELTEGVLISHPAIAKSKLERLRQAGFSISLDDFGTGYSSIGYLRQITFDKLKIDRGFVTNSETDPQAAGLLHSIAQIGKVLGLSIVAEGVETEEQARITRLAGCNLQQGYYYSKPIALSALMEKYGVTDVQEARGDARLLAEAG